jgi:four helix bundle protein
MSSSLPSVPSSLRSSGKTRTSPTSYKRAATSASLNLAEGNRRAGRDRVARFRIASGECGEAVDALRLAVGFGYVADGAIAGRARPRRSALRHALAPHAPAAVTAPVAGSGHRAGSGDRART